LFKLKPIAGLQALTINDNIPTRRIADKCGYEVEPPGDAAVKESQR
jgi:RimJ/RimL family protein N-acetyltransferase